VVPAAAGAAGSGGGGVNQCEERWRGERYGGSVAAIDLPSYFYDW